LVSVSKEGKMNGKELEKEAVELAARATGAYVTTVGSDGYPRTRVMFNLRNRSQFPNLVPLFASHDEDLLMYLGTNTSSAKIEEVRRDPKACIYLCDYAQTVGMMFAGDLEVVGDARVRRALWTKGWEIYYPAGPDDPDYTVLRLYPKFVSGWLRSSRVAFRVEER
jgi:general stress protein 26